MPVILLLRRLRWVPGWCRLYSSEKEVGKEKEEKNTSKFRGIICKYLLFHVIWLWFYCLGWLSNSLSCWDVLVGKDGFNHAHWQATILIAVVRASPGLPASLNIPTRWPGLSLVISCLACSHFPTTRVNCITIHKLRVDQGYLRTRKVVDH